MHTLQCQRRTWFSQLAIIYTIVHSHLLVEGGDVVTCMSDYRNQRETPVSVPTCHLLEKGSATIHHCAHQGDSNLPGIVLCPLPIPPEEHWNCRHVLLCPDVSGFHRFKPRSSYMHDKCLTYWAISSTHGGASQLPTTPPWETTSSPTIPCSCAALASSLHFARGVYLINSLPHQRGRLLCLWCV